jgi:crotonobetainyl-CoA:carnitine CoA-transferase CaiB-like acyl-CoA transferase
MALSGIKVVEVSTWAAGPSCGMWLAENGADVVRVEPIEGDPVRGMMQSGVVPVTDLNWLWEMWNRSKRGIAVNLGQGAGQEIVHKLVAQADVFLANLRPGTLKKAQLDYETLNELNPRLIYANITGYGPKGPGADWPSFDEIGFWARSGIMAVLGEPDTPLVPLRGAMGDHTTGMFTLGGIALALYVRERTGRGQRVDVSLVGSGTWVAGCDVQGALIYDQDMPRFSRKTIGNPLYNHYECKDRKWVQFQMLQTDRYWSGVCKALGREDLEHDPSFDSHQKRVENNVELIAILDEVLATKSRDEWAPRFNENGLVWGPAQTPMEVTQDPCVLENKYIVEYEHFSGRKVRGITCPIQLSKNPTRAPHGAPEYSQHTEEVLLEMGYSWDDITKLKDSKVIP